MGKLYNIRSSDLIFYLLFNVVIIPFQIIVNVLIHNMLELVFNWRLWECGSHTSLHPASRSLSASHARHTAGPLSTVLYVKRVAGCL